jgi:hypothetical protein
MWEYTYVSSGDMDELIDKANQMGLQGWEAISLTTTKQGFGWGNHILALKRQK